MGVSTWTPERVQTLKALWTAGVSAGGIAKQLGMTRGMVAGKRHSLGLPARIGAVRRAAEAANGRRTAVLCGRLGKLETPRSMAQREKVEAMERLFTPLRGSNPKPWELRVRGECAFPVAGYGDQTVSCCEPVELGRAYCLGHCELLAGRRWPPRDAEPALAATQWEPVPA